MSVIRRALSFPKNVYSFVVFKRSFFIQTRNEHNELINDLRKTQYMWRHKDKKMYDFLSHCYSKSEGSFSYAVQLITLACGHANCSYDLIFNMVTAFESFSKNHNIAYSPSLVEKTEILNSILTYKDYKLLQLACSVFNLIEDAQYFKELIERLVDEHKLIEAALCVSALNLQQEYAYEKILLPLLIEGKLYASILYMKNNSDLQLEVVKILDSLLSKNKTSAEKSVTHVNSRLLLKTLTSLLNTFRISTDHCKNLHCIRSKGAINHLIRRRAQQSVSESTWQEMVMEVVGENEELKEFLILKLLSRKDIRTATEIAEKLRVPETKLSALLSLYSQVVKAEQTETLEDMCNENDDFSSDDSGNLMFALSLSDIKLIDNKEDFRDCINTILQNYDIVGIDSEWKPYFGLATERLSLIQLAVQDKVFILDMLSLTECLETEDWDQFMDDIFGNPNIIKLGCGIMCDVQMIIGSNKGTKGKVIKFSHVIDISLFYQKLQEIYPEKVENDSDEEKNSMKGLSRLCEIVLGKPLSKEQRLCDWEKRPLENSQIQYAALDAHCLLQIYEKWKQDALEKNMNFSHLSKLTIVSTAAQWKPKKKFKGKRIDKACYIHPPVHIQQFKIIMDSALCDLGNELKLFGADVVILKDSDSPDYVAELSKSTKRIIICKEELFKQVKEKVNDGFCYNATLNFKEQITSSHILQHFNVLLSAKSISPS